MPLNLTTLLGQRFHKLTIIQTLDHDSRGHLFVLCQCDCGNTKRIRYDSLKRKKEPVKSCGCLINGHLTHGMAASKTNKVWRDMRQRCNDPTNNYYGGRGITACERWNSFTIFLADMGECPAGHSIERRDYNGNYTPDNCYWATPKQQARNRRNNTFVTAQGKSKTIAEWSEITGIKPATISARLRIQQWTPDKALGFT